VNPAREYDREHGINGWFLSELGDSVREMFEKR
jgi:hypothetical protein